MTVDRARAAAFLRRRRGGDRPASDPFVSNALRHAAPGAANRHGEPDRLYDLVRRIREHAAALAGLAAVADQHPARGLSGPFPVSVAIRLPNELAEVASAGALAYARLSAVLQGIERASAQSALDQGRGA